MELVFVGVRTNKNWILGNWTNELSIRLPIVSGKRWFPTAFAKGRRIESIYPKWLPKAKSYFFSYPTLFAAFAENPRISRAAIVLYTHNEQPELGSDREQVTLLNKAFSVHFFSSIDATRLVANGLHEEKVRIVNGAIDLDLPSGSLEWQQRQKLILLASKFGPRKGAEKLPELVNLLEDWNFLILGRGWDEFLEKNGLRKKSNFDYKLLSKESRNVWFPNARVFLSLSNLEGGPIPLLEACHTGSVPVVSDTGFARDVLGEFCEQHIFPIEAEPIQISHLIRSAQDPRNNFRNKVSIFTWDRLARILQEDIQKIFLST